MNFALVIDPLDGAALDVALALAGSDVDTFAITVGDDTAEPLARAAKARGCTRAIRVWDEGLVGVDYLAIAQVLQRTVRMLSGDAMATTRVFAGDRGRGAVSCAVADRLGIASLANVKSVERQGDRLIATRADAERFVIPGAALLAIVPDEARALTTDAGAGAEVARVTLGDVGLLAAELVHRRRFVRKAI